MSNKVKQKADACSKIYPGLIYTVGLEIMYFLINCSGISFNKFTLSYCYFFYLTLLVGGIFLAFLKKISSLSKIIMIASVIVYFSISLFS